MGLLPLGDFCCRRVFWSSCRQHSLCLEEDILAIAETKPQNTWDLAKSLNQTIVILIVGPMYGVYYPHRKTGDLYVAISGHPIRCCQCNQDIPVDDGLESWQEHIRLHSRRKLVNPILFVGKDTGGKLFTAQKKQEVNL